MKKLFFILFCFANATNLYCMEQKKLNRKAHATQDQATEIDYEGGTQEAYDILIEALESIESTTRKTGLLTHNRYCYFQATIAVLKNQKPANTEMLSAIIFAITEKIQKYSPQPESMSLAVGEIEALQTLLQTKKGLPTAACCAALEKKQQELYMQIFHLQVENYLLKKQAGQLKSTTHTT